MSEPHERPASLGLGLYIAREIVGGHGGTLVVTSSAEEGTAFSVRLPVIMAEPKQT
ncbi:sensor histidine kinase [Variovorax guangxiensis]|uniref:sensor histidine kinase n=1 Tax=Variovorax guangxiensis TaxID=1775474 RepID=UPI0038F6E902